VHVYLLIQQTNNNTQNKKVRKSETRNKEI